MVKELSSTIKIDDDVYNVNAKTAETASKVTNKLKITKGANTLAEFDGSTDTTVNIPDAAQADWEETKTASAAYIKNKPPIGTAATKNVDASITANSTSTNLPTSKAVAELVASVQLKDEEGNVVDLSKYALKSTKITAGNGLTGTGTLDSDITIAVGGGNGITVTADAIAAKAGNGITVDSTGINHKDTSSQESIVASGRTYITGVTLDTYGHVTGLTTGTETVTDTNQKIKAGSTTFGAADEVNLVAGSNVTITGNASAKTVTIGTNFSALITHGTTDPTADTASTYYFKY